MATCETGRRDEMAHDHCPDYRAAGRLSLRLVQGLVGCHRTAEMVGGRASGSLGLLANATCTVTNAVAISLAPFAMWIARQPATITRKFGIDHVTLHMEPSATEFTGEHHVGLLKARTLSES